MSRQTWVGVFLITLLMFLWTLWIASTSTSAPPALREGPSSATVPDTTPSPLLEAPSVGSDSVARRERFGVYARFVEGHDSLLTVETPTAYWVLGSRGARLHYHQRKDFSTADGSPVSLWDSTQKSTFLFAEGRTILSARDLYFEPLYAPKGPITGTDSVVFALRFAPDTQLRVTYTFSAHDERVGWRVQFIGLSSRLRNPYIRHNITYETPLTEPTPDLMKPHCALYYRQADEVEALAPDAEEPIQKTLQGRIQWISAKGQFFCALFQGDTPFTEATLTSLPYTRLPRYELQLQLPLQNGTASETWYFGPTRYTTLRSYGQLYEKQLNLGWAFIRYINTGFIIPVFAFLERFIGSYGLIITILALLVKIILSPLTWRGYLLGVQMQVVNELPEVKALEEKYKDQPDKLMIERSLLYRQLGVNPLRGCVPLLLQIPIFFAMTSFFPNAFELRQEGFLWAKDLSSYDAVLKWGFSIPLLGDHLSLFALLTALSTLAYTYFTQQTQAAATPALKWLPYLTPIIFFLFLNSYSAALSWYYFVLNVLTIVQTLLMKQFIDKGELERKLREIQRKKQGKAAIAQQRARIQQMQKWFRKK